MGPGMGTRSPNRTLLTSAKPTSVVNETLEISWPSAVVSVKKFCPVPLTSRSRIKLNSVPNWSKTEMFAVPLALASRLKTAAEKKKPGTVVIRLFKVLSGTASIRLALLRG